MSPHPPVARLRATRILLVLLCTFGFACATQKSSVNAPPPPARTIQPSHSERIQTARIAFAQGRYDEAYAGFEQVLEQSPTGGLRIEALYHLAVIELIRDPKARNFSRARDRLGEVKVNSDYRRAEVEAILELLVTLEDTRASSRRQGETIRAQEEALEQKEEALRSVTETLIGSDP